MPWRNCRLSASRSVSAATGLPASVSAIRWRAVASVCASVLLNRPAMRTGSTKRWIRPAHKIPMAISSTRVTARSKIVPGAETAGKPIRLAV
ncbi:hypothetical protein SB00610_04449 [Klebsiella quasipneumoniae subsp. similipneumoniae]|nr:hypothetical protein SB00610_04449 [Klebsiella quasipneumoniae subsp. similipneumoniae]